MSSLVAVNYNACFSALVAPQWLSVLCPFCSVVMHSDLRMIKGRICTFLKLGEEEGFEHMVSFTCIRSEFVGHCCAGLVSVPVARNDPEVLCGRSD